MPLNKKVARACYKHETKTLVDKWIRFGTISAPNDRMLQLLQAFCRSRRSRLKPDSWATVASPGSKGWGRVVCGIGSPPENVCVCVCVCVEMVLLA